MLDKGLSIKKQGLSAKLKTVKLLSFLISFAVFFFCFLGLGVENKAHAATYYVDSSITDTNPASATPDCTNYNTSTFTCSGGAESAYKTIADVNAKSFSPDDQILFRKGQTWREMLTNSSSGTSGHPIIYGAFGSGSKPSIRGSNLYNVAGNWTNELGSLWYASSITADPGVFVHDGSLGLRKTLKVSLTTQWDYWFDSGNSRLYVYSSANPTTLASNLEIAVRDSFVDTVFWNNVTYQNLDIRHTKGGYAALLFTAGANINFDGVDFSQLAKYGIQYNRSGVGAVTNCTFTDWGVVDGQQYAVQVISNSGTSGAVDITGSTFTINHSMNTTELVAVMSDMYGWVRTFSNNTVVNNGTMPMGSGIFIWQPGGSASSITIEHNSISNTGSSGIGIEDIESHGASPTVIIRYNYIKNSNQSDALDTEALRVRGFTASSNVQASYNVIDGCKAGSNWHPGVYLYQAVGAKIYNNTISGCEPGILVKNASTGNNIRNNISVNNRSYGIDVQDTSTVTTFNHNLFYNNTSGNYNGISAGTGDVTTDPYFVGGGEAKPYPYFYPRSYSPVINAGTDVGLTKDYLNVNVPQGAAPDIGAFEYTVSIPENIWFFFPLFLALPRLIFLLQNKKDRKYFLNLLKTRRYKAILLELYLPYLNLFSQLTKRADK